MYLDEQYKIVPLVAPADQGGGVNSAGLDISNAHHVTIIMLLGAQTNALAQVNVKYGTTHETMVADLPTLYAWRTNADIGAVAGDKLTNAVTREAGEEYFFIPANDNRMIVIEVPVSEIPSGNNWIRVEIGDQGTDTFASIVAIVQPRYQPLATAVRLA